MKNITYGLVFLSALFLSGCSLANKSLQPNVNVQKTTVTESLQTEAQKELTIQWNGIVNGEKLNQCIQSKKDFDQKKTDLLQRYKEVLNKELESKKLTIGEQYIKTIYGWLEARGRDYRVFEEMKNDSVPSNMNDLIGKKNLIDFVYCPTVSKVPVSYPLTPDGCNELLLSWMAPFEVPSPRDYKVDEEYKLALEKFKSSDKNRSKIMHNCCYGGDRGMSCTSLVSFLK